MSRCTESLILRAVLHMHWTLKKLNFKDWKQRNTCQKFQKTTNVKQGRVHAIFWNSFYILFIFALVLHLDLWMLYIFKIGRCSCITRTQDTHTYRRNFVQKTWCVLCTLTEILNISNSMFLLLLWNFATFHLYTLQ